MIIMDKEIQALELMTAFNTLDYEANCENGLFRVDDLYGIYSDNYTYATHVSYVKENYDGTLLVIVQFLSKINVSKDQLNALMDLANKNEYNFKEQNFEKRILIFEPRNMKHGCGCCE